MGYMKLFNFDGKSYIPRDGTSNGLWRLAMFLSQDVRYMQDAKSNGFYRWLFDVNSTITGGNTCTIKKSDEHDGLITIGDSIELRQHDEIIFETNAAELAGILERWAELCRELPKEILILRENGKITLEAVQ